MRNSWRGYFELVKPGITISNLITTLAGICLASDGFPEWGKAVWTLLGTALVISSGAAFNNYIDRELDRKMERTKGRILPAGLMKPYIALIAGIVLLGIGVLILALKVNVLAALLGFLGHIFYAFIYTPLKRITTLNTVIGGISGAVPPVIGWVAVTNQIDMGAWILFIILFLWQPPHFLALAMLKVEDYRRGGIPMLPVTKGFTETKRQMLLWGSILFPASLLLFFYGKVGFLYFIVTFVTGSIYLIMLFSGFSTKDDMKWAKRLFGYSIIYLSVLCTSIVVSSWVNKL